MHQGRLNCVQGDPIKMNSHTLLKYLVVMASVLTVGIANAQKGADKNGRNCAEWVAKKRMFLLSERSVTGTSCAVNLEIKRANDSTERADDTSTIWSPQSSLTRPSTPMNRKGPNCIDLTRRSQTS